MPQEFETLKIPKRLNSGSKLWSLSRKIEWAEKLALVLQGYIEAKKKAFNTEAKIRTEKLIPSGRERHWRDTYSSKYQATLQQKGISYD